MKKDIHPKNYRLVVFEDLNDGTKILTKSTIASEETTKWEDGNEYPHIKVHISSSSHPFYTGQEKLVDIEGRVDKFEARRRAAAKSQKAREDKAAIPIKEEAKSQEKGEEKSVAQKIG
jgi:large subunit ribosomal protein L31